MRTCSECGCYLPDGKTECLACGHDNTRRSPFCDISLPAGGVGCAGGKPNYGEYAYLSNGFTSQMWPVIKPIGTANCASIESQIRCNIASLQDQLDQQTRALHCTIWGFPPEGSQ